MVRARIFQTISWVRREPLRPNHRSHSAIDGAAVFTMPPQLRQAQRVADTVNSLNHFDRVPSIDLFAQHFDVRIDGVRKEFSAIHTRS